MGKKSRKNLEPKSAGRPTTSRGKGSKEIGLQEPSEKDWEKGWGEEALTL